MNQTTKDKNKPRPSNGILTRFTSLDTGRIQIPQLAPHFHFHVLDEQQTLLVSETLNTLLKGNVYPHLLPLLDGYSGRQKIVGKLAGKFTELEIENALLALASRGYVVSGEHDVPDQEAAYWTSLGASPSWVFSRLGSNKISITGDTDGKLSQHIKSAGISITKKKPTMSVFVCADYLEDQFEAINQEHRKSEVPWLLVKPNGLLPMFGPVFQPTNTGPCWKCLAYRLQGHQEVHNFLRNVTGNSASVLSRSAQSSVVNAVYSLAVIEIARWLIFEDIAPLNNHVISVDAAKLQTKKHYAMARPQCSECGEPRYYDPERQPLPVELQPNPKPIKNSGGTRSTTPEQTLSRFQHLVSPISGVVTWLELSSDEVDSWFHVHTSGSNFALHNKNLSTLRRSLRSKTVGKGSTRKQSEASALCEAIERYSCAFHGDEVRRSSSLAALLDSDETAAIHPNSVQLFSDYQIENCNEINARAHPYNIVPDRFDPNLPISWSPMWSLTREKHRYLPTSVLYTVPPDQREVSKLASDSNGCAAGNTLEEAILQGFLELAERDAFGIWWYNRLRMPEVDLNSFDDEYLSAAPDYYRKINREVWVLDVTNDLGIPTFVAISKRTDSTTEDILYGAGAHLDPHIAALRAVCELNQFLNLVRPAGTTETEYRINDPVCLKWFEDGKIDTHAYLAPSPNKSPRCRADYQVPDTSDVLDDVIYCRNLVESKGMEFLVLDNTRPDIGLPVVRVVVPGLRHFWERFAPGRLYDVPVEMGWRDTPLSESELNPFPVIV